jgi:uncharacterized repeat protein (TIGR03803 family)
MRVLRLIVCCAFLASCSRGISFTPYPNAQLAQRERGLAADVYRQLYTFKGGADGANPVAGLTEVNGAFYGTTSAGGTSYGWGTVFKVGASGKEHVIYKFKANNDGAHPYAGLIDVNGTLYGTTYQGGTSGSGTVFKVSTSGAEHVVYSFKGGSDGQYPYGRLIAIGSELYGTTSTGGAEYGWGTVFRVSVSGKEEVLYRFEANNKGTHDGAHPFGGLLDYNGVLYGTTHEGGTKGAGTVFRMTTGGTEHVVYSFKGGSDGQFPYCRLVALNGELYGTTYQGGISPGWGIVFKVTTGGTEKILHKFEAGQDGAHPQFAGLVNVGGLFYGTTYQGGASGNGTIFSTTPGGIEKVVYSFRGGDDGQYPYDGLLNSGGSLYGTAYQGGADSVGTVFKLTP